MEHNMENKRMWFEILHCRFQRTIGANILMLENGQPTRSHVKEMEHTSEIIDAPELAKRLHVPVSWVGERATSPGSHQSRGFRTFALAGISV
jgi:hypothetical protein